MGKVKVPITATAVNFGVMFKGPGDKQEEAYVMILVDPSKQIFNATKVKDKSPFSFPPTAMVTILDDIPGQPPPSVGPILLSLK